MSERYEFDVDWFDLPPDVRRTWCDWARHHGVDPNVVTVPGWIERQPTERRIAYLSFVPDEAGRPTLTPDRQDVAQEVRVVQLEAVPSPFPFEVES